MRSVLGLGLLAVMFSATAFAQDAAPVGNDGPRKHFNFIVGQKMLDDKDWNKEFKAAGLPNLATQTSFGLESTWGLGKLPVSLAVDLLYASASGKSTALNRTVTGTTIELGFGVRKVFDVLPVPVHPYVGGGFAYGTGAVTCSGCSSKAPSGTGLFVNGGAFYRLSKFNVGAGIRYSAIDGKDGPVKLKVGGINANLVVGVGF